MGRLLLPLTLLCIACTSSTTPPAQGGAGHSGSGSAAAAGTAGGSAVCTYDPRIDPPADCPNDVPSACPAAAPSYSSTVSAVIAANCRPCHRKDGFAPDKPFDTYDQVFQVRTTMLNRVSRCIMPPACAAQPSTEQRQALLQWLVCSAPNN